MKSTYARFIERKRRRWPLGWRLSHTTGLVLAGIALITGAVITWPATHDRVLAWLMALRDAHAALGAALVVLLAGGAAAVFPYRRNRVDWIPIIVLVVLVTLSGVALLWPGSTPAVFLGWALPVHLWASWALVGWVAVHALRKTSVWRWGEAASVRADRRAFLQNAANWTGGAVLASLAVPVMLGSLKSLSAAGGAGGPAGAWQIYSYTGTFPKVSPSAYRLKVGGLVAHPKTFSLSDLIALGAQPRVTAFHCVTGWVVQGVRWEGVPLTEILAAVGPTAEAVYVQFGSSDGTYIDSLSLAELGRAQAFLAYRMDGRPLEIRHGGPVRLVVPPMFGYKSVKWVNAIELVRTKPEGTWEAYGYPDEAWIGQA